MTRWDARPLRRGAIIGLLCGLAASAFAQIQAVAAYVSSLR